MRHQGVFNMNINQENNSPINYDNLSSDIDLFADEDTNIPIPESSEATPSSSLNVDTPYTPNIILKAKSEVSENTPQEDLENAHDPEGNLPERNVNEKRVESADQSISPRKALSEGKSSLEDTKEKSLKPLDDPINQLRKKKSDSIQSDLSKYQDHPKVQENSDNNNDYSDNSNSKAVSEDSEVVSNSENNEVIEKKDSKVVFKIDKLLNIPKYIGVLNETNLYQFLEESSRREISNKRTLKVIAYDLNNLKQYSPEEQETIQKAIALEKAIFSNDSNTFQPTPAMDEELKKHKCEQLEFTLPSGETRIVEVKNLQVMNGATSSALCAAVGLLLTAVINARLQEEQDKRKQLESHPPHIPHIGLEEEPPPKVKPKTLFQYCFCKVEKGIINQTSEIIGDRMERSKKERKEQEEIEKYENRAQMRVKRDVDETTLKREDGTKNIRVEEVDSKDKQTSKVEKEVNKREAGKLIKEKVKTSSIDPDAGTIDVIDITKEKRPSI